MVVYFFEKNVHNEKRVHKCLKHKITSGFWRFLEKLFYRWLCTFFLNNFKNVHKGRPDEIWVFLYFVYIVYFFIKLNIYKYKKI